MSALGDAEQAIEAVVPEARWTGLAVRAGLGLIAAIAIGFVIWWVLIRPASDHQAAVQAKVDAATAKAGAGAAQDTVKIVVVHDQAAAAIDAQTQENDHAIRSAPGASTPVDPAFADTLRHALCMRVAYQRQPGCAAVLGNGGGVGPAEPDAWRSTPDGLDHSDRDAAGR
jgi:hypothetical protein